MNTTTIQRSFLPKKCQILSGSALKLLAVTIMLIDHVAAFLLSKYQPALTGLFTLSGRDYSLYRICRDVGRSAFPIFCFLLVEGYIHTRDRKKYGVSLLLFACVSELPWNLIHSGSFFYERQNVFFTLFLGYLGICAFEYFADKPLIQLLALLALFGVAYYLKADYGWRGYIFILIMYLFRYNGAAQAIIGSCWLAYEWKACFAFISINMYNGERGFIRGKAAKYFFYAFYPVHLFLLYLLKQYLFL